MTELNKWVENEFNPWKKAMADYEDKDKRAISIVQKNAAELKYIISLLLEKREAEAVKIWNDLELYPTLKNIQFDIAKDVIIMTSLNDTEQSLSITSLLEELELMLNA